MLIKITEYYSGIELYAFHPDKKYIPEQEWMAICDEVNERYRPIHDQWQKALNEAEEDTRNQHFTPSDPEWLVMIKEYFQDHGIILTTLREMLITVLKEKSYEVFEKAAKYSIRDLSEMKRELLYQCSWGRVYLARLPR